MSLADAIRARRSTRAFASEPVSDDVIRAMVDAARMAPSGGNRQMWRFRAIRERATLEAMRASVASRLSATAEAISSPRAREQYATYTSTFLHFADAPCVIVVLGRPYDSIYTRIVNRYGGAETVQPGGADVTALSIGAAVENMLLAATALGVGSCLMTGPLIARSEMEEILAVKEPWTIAALVPVGHPAAAPAERSLLGLEEILDFD
jgi:nitroreductase